MIIWSRRTTTTSVTFQIFCHVISFPEVVSLAIFHLMIEFYFCQVKFLHFHEDLAMFLNSNLLLESVFASFLSLTTWHSLPDWWLHPLAIFFSLLVFYFYFYFFNLILKSLSGISMWVCAVLNLIPFYPGEFLFPC